jgi:hypothetical protein
MASAALPPARSIDFGRALRFVIEDPDWVKKILIGSAFSLLTAILIGAPFVAGYFTRLLRNVARGEGRPLPPWDDLGGIFRDGLRTLAVYAGHFAALMALPLTGGCLIALVMGTLATPERAGRASDAVGMLAGVGLVGVYALAAVLMLVLLVYVPAAALRFALTDRVGAAFEPREVIALIRRNLGNYLLVIVLYVLASFVSQFGVFLCCVGVFPLSFWALCLLGWGLGEFARLEGLGER